MALSKAEVGVPGDALVIRHAKVTLQQFKDEAERADLVSKLREQEWNIAATAKAIDTPRSNLYKKLDTYAISKEKDGAA